jgi:hypothetical protein
MGKLVEAFKEIGSAAENSGKALEDALLEVEDLPQSVKNNISLIVNNPETVNSLRDLVGSIDKAREANEIYAKTIM